MFDIVAFSSDLQKVNMLYREDLVAVLKNRQAPDELVKAIDASPARYFTRDTVLTKMKEFFLVKELTLEPPLFLMKG